MSEVTEVVEVAEVEVAVKAREKKLVKSNEAGVVTIEAIGGTKGVMTFDTALLPQEIKDAMIPFGISHRLGDSAAGRSGEDAEKAIEAVWAGLLAGEFTTRQPASPKVKLSSIKDAVANMSPEDAAKARELMAQMGIKL